MRFSGRRAMKHTKIEIIPMIDTMFFLLVFFILASLNIIDLRGLNLNLPPAGTNSQKIVDPKEVKVEIAIDKDGNKVINKTIEIKQGKSGSKEILDVVEAQLGRKADAKDLSEVTVTILPDEDTWHQYVIQAVDDARGAKIQKFAVH